MQLDPSRDPGATESPQYSHGGPEAGPGEADWVAGSELVTLLESAPSPFGVDERRVVIRLHGGEDIVVGTAEGREAAVRIARDVVRAIEAATARGDWPEVENRFLRPGAIVSVDVQRAS